MKAELKATNQALKAANKELANSSRRSRTGSTSSSTQVYAIDREQRPYGPREQPLRDPQSYQTMRSRNHEQPVENKRRPNGPRQQPPSSYRPPYVEDGEESVEQEPQGEDWFGTG